MANASTGQFGQEPVADGARFSSGELESRTIYRRAVEAVIWGMPAVNFDLMLQSFKAAGGGPNQVPYWSWMLDEANQTLTPNIDDCWQNALEDVGPAGADLGEGGKYLILPPGYDAHVPAGYIPVRSDTYQGFVILRSDVKTSASADVAGRWLMACR